VEPAESPRPLTETEVTEAVISLGEHPLGVDEEVRVSLGGLQSKLLLVETPEGWAKPEGGMPSTHILKPDPPEFPGLVVSEAFAQRAAALAGLPAAAVRLDTFGGKLVLVVTRFDREMRSGRLVRLHQEDGCQALAVDPSGPDKYQALDGKASYRRLASVITSFADDEMAELRRLGAMLTFTVAVGNTDAHLRNHAFMHRGGGVTLAPIYDAAPAVQFAGTRKLALWVDGQVILAVVTRRHLIRELVSWGLEEGESDHIVDSVLERLADSYDNAACAIPEVSDAIVADCKIRTGNLLRQR
jgi:serine/threonine-protein kinase HipA